MRLWLDSLLLIGLRTSLANSTFTHNNDDTLSYYFPPNYTKTVRPVPNVAVSVFFDVLDVREVDSAERSVEISVSTWTEWTEPRILVERGNASSGESVSVDCQPVLESFWRPSKGKK